MGHNSVVSGHPKSTRIPLVDGLSTGPSDLGCHMKRPGENIGISSTKSYANNTLLCLKRRPSLD